MNGGRATFAEEPVDRGVLAPAVAVVVAAHLAGGWALLQVSTVRDAAPEAAPLVVDLLAPAPPAPQPPPAPRRMARAPAHVSPPIVAAPSPPAAPAVFEAPAAPPTPLPVPAIAAAPQPPAPPPPAPLPPKTVAASEVAYLVPPVPVYPLPARRAREQGTVTLQVLIDEGGLPSRIVVRHSSGFARLDASAVAAMQQARFRPYVEGGIARAVWAPAPIAFSLEN